MKKLILSLSIISLCICGTLTYNFNNQNNIVYADEIEVNKKQAIGTLFILYLATCGITLTNSIRNVGSSIGNWLSNLNLNLFNDIELKRNPTNSNGQIELTQDTIDLFNEGINDLNLNNNEEFIKSISNNGTFSINRKEWTGTGDSTALYSVLVENNNTARLTMHAHSGAYYPGGRLVTNIYEFPKNTILNISNDYGNEYTYICSWQPYFIYSTDNLSDYNNKKAQLINNDYVISGYDIYTYQTLSKSNTGKTLVNEYNMLLVNMAFSFQNAHNGGIITIKNPLPNLLVNTQPQTQTIENLIGTTTTITQDTTPINLSIPNIDNTSTWDDLYDVSHYGDITKENGNQSEMDDEIVLPYPNVNDLDYDDETSINIGNSLKFGTISLIAKLLLNIFTAIITIPQKLSKIWEKIQGIDYTSILTSINETIDNINNALNRTYTIEDIQSITWINAITNFETTITNAINTMKTNYNLYIGNFLTGISHPQSNQLTIMVNDVLTNTNLYWCVYAIISFSLLRYFI